MFVGRSKFEFWHLNFSIEIPIFDDLSGGWGLRQLSPTAKELCYCDHRMKKIIVAVSVVCDGGQARTVSGQGGVHVLAVAQANW